MLREQQCNLLSAPEAAAVVKHTKGTDQAAVAAVAVGFPTIAAKDYTVVMLL
jgi:hypothetical protein